MFTNFWKIWFFRNYNQIWEAMQWLTTSKLKPQKLNKTQILMAHWLKLKNRCMKMYIEKQKIWKIRRYKKTIHLIHDTIKIFI